MKANESVQNFPAKLRLYTNYTVREIKNICKTIGPRPSATDKEKEAQEHMAEQMKSCCDTVETESFEVHPKAFMGWVLIDGISLLLALVFSLIKMPVVSLVLCIVAAVCMATEFLMYWQFLDPLFPKKTAYNVIGKRKPTGEVKQRIIFSGHIDSSYEWYYTHVGGSKMLVSTIVYAIVGLVFCLVVSIGSTVNGGAVNSEPNMLWTVLGYVQLAFAPGFVMILFFVNWKRPVDGANDNLTGVVASVAVLKFLEDNDIRFENTEVCALSSACEEAGLRGARAYVKAHKAELDEIPTVFYGMDTLTDYDYMAIYNRDMTGTVKNDARVCALMKKGAENAGLDLPFESVFFGASDAAAVSKLGVPAATFAAMDPAPARYYHTREDTVEVMSPKTVEAALGVCLETLFLFDEQGLKDSY